MNARDAAKRFGSQVRTWRVQQSLSLEDLADLLKLTKVQAASIELGTENDVVTAQWPRILADLKRLEFEVSSP